MNSVCGCIAALQPAVEATTTEVTTTEATTAEPRKHSIFSC